MSYTIELASNDGYVCLTHTDDVSVKEFERGREEVIDVIKSIKHKRLLVDTRCITSKIKIGDHYSFTSSHPGVLPIGIKIALLVRFDDMKSGKFAEDIAFNRAINLRTFNEKNEALKWLISKPTNTQQDTPLGD